MLNTLYHLAQTLEKEGLLEPPRHKNLTKINSPWVIWIGVDKNGDHDVSVTQNTGNCLKLQIDNMNSWPGIGGNIPITAHPPEVKKKNEAKENWEKLQAFLLNQDITQACLDLVQDAVTKGLRAKKFLPQDPGEKDKTNGFALAESARATTEILSSEQEDIAKKLEKAIKTFIKGVEDHREGKRIAKTIFLLPKEKPMKIPILLGRATERNAILGGSLVEKAVASLSTSATTGGESLFGNSGERPVFSGYPLMEMPYYPASRAGDFPALGGYFKQDFSPIAAESLQKIRSALDYLCTPANNLCRKVSLGTGEKAKTYLLLACPETRSGLPVAQNVLEKMCPEAHRKPKTEEEKTKRSMEFEEGARSTLYPEKESEGSKENIEVVVLTQTMKANIQTYHDDRKPFQDWKEIFRDWTADQMLENGWFAMHGASIYLHTSIWEIGDAVGSKFLTEKGRLKSEADKRTHETKGVSIKTFLQPRDKNPLARLAALQRTLLGQISKNTIATLTDNKMRDPMGKEPIDIFAFKKAMGILILTTTRIENHMSENPLHNTPGFLVGQALHNLNRLEMAYRAIQETKRQDKRTVGKNSLRGSRLLGTAESPNLARTLHAIGRDAKAYLDLADFVVRSKKNEEEDKPWSPDERAITHAAKALRQNLQDIGEKTEGLIKVPRTLQEIQQHKALVRIGINSRLRNPKPEKDKPSPLILGSFPIVEQTTRCIPPA